MKKIILLILAIILAVALPAYAVGRVATWDKPAGVTVPVWYVSCIYTINHLCIPMNFFGVMYHLTAVAGTETVHTFTFDEASLGLAPGTHYCVQVAGVIYNHWPYGDWSYPVCVTAQ